MNRTIRQYWNLFVSFIKIGAFTFGSGYAMITLIQKEICEKHGWLSEDEILEIIAVAESTPGSITINTATFVGYKVGGIAGSALATLGVIIPSFLIIISIVKVLTQFEDNIYVQYAFNGIRIGVFALVIKAFVTMLDQVSKNAFSYALILLATLAVAVWNCNVFGVIVISALLGIVHTLNPSRREVA